MSIRWRTTGELLCGAKSEPMEDDTYIDDRLHYELSVERGLLIPDDDEGVTGKWHWNPDIRGPLVLTDSEEPK